jgi:Domain of unknown function (DUF1877)
MAMSTTLFAVTPEVLSKLEASPETISEFESKKTFGTYLWTTLPYFLSGGETELDDDEEEDEEDEEDDDDDDDDEDDDDDARHPLAPVLIGTRAVPCNRLENGAFHVVPVAKVRELAALLAKVDREELKEKVLEAELEELDDGEVWEELEQLDLSEPQDVAAAVLEDLKGLTSFYAFAAKQGLAIVLYTT